MRSDFKSTHNSYPWKQVVEGHGFLWSSKDLVKLKKAVHAWSKKTGIAVAFLPDPVPTECPVVRVVRADKTAYPSKVEPKKATPDGGSIPTKKIKKSARSEQIDTLIMDYLEFEKNKTSDTVNIIRWVSSRLTPPPKSNNTVHRRLKVLAEQGWLKREKNFFGVRDGWKLLVSKPSQVLAPIMKSETEEEKTGGMIFKWVRGKNGTPIGCLVGVDNNESSTGFSIGWSMNTREPFDKIRGLQIAVGRTNFNITKPLPRSLTQEYMQFLDRCSRYFKN